MNLLVIYIQVYPIFTILKMVNGYVLLAANMNDIKTIAKEFVPEDLVEQLARAVFDLYFSKTIYREDGDQQSEESSSDKQSAIKESIYEPRFIARKSETNENYVINKGKKINFEQLVIKVKKRLEKEINKNIKTLLEQQKANVSLARGRKEKIIKKSTSKTISMANLDYDTKERYTLNSTSVKPRKSVHKTKTKERHNNHNKNITDIHNDDTFKVTNKQNTGRFLNKRNYDGKNVESTRKVETPHKIEEKNSKLINKNNRFKIEERKDFIEDSSDEKNTDFDADPEFSELGHQSLSKSSTPSTTNKQKYYSNISKKDSNDEDDVTPIRKKVDKSKQNTFMLIEKKKNNEPETSVSSDEDREETIDEDKETREKSQGSTTRRSLESKKYKNKQNIEKLPIKNNKWNEADKRVSSEEKTMVNVTKAHEYLRKNKMAHNESNQLENPENSVSTEDETKKKSTERKSISRKRVTVSSKPSIPVEVSSEDVYDDEFKISTIASSEIKGETQSLSLMDDLVEFEIKPTIKLSRDVYTVRVPDFVKKTTAYAETYNFDEPIPEDDRKREEIKYLGEKAGIVNKKKITSVDEENN